MKLFAARVILIFLIYFNKIVLSVHNSTLCSLSFLENELGYSVFLHKQATDNTNNTRLRIKARCDSRHDMFGGGLLSNFRNVICREGSWYELKNDEFQGVVELPLAKCVPEYHCDPPEIPLNGDFFQITSFIDTQRIKDFGAFSGTVIQYSCDSGYTLAPTASERRCDISGTWMPPLPVKCVSVLTYRQTFISSSAAAFFCLLAAFLIFLTAVCRRIRRRNNTQNMGAPLYHPSGIHSIPPHIIQQSFTSSFPRYPIQSRIAFFPLHPPRGIQTDDPPTYEDSVRHVGTNEAPPSYDEGASVDRALIFNRTTSETASTATTHTTLSNDELNLEIPRNGNVCSNVSA